MNEATDGVRCMVVNVYKEKYDVYIGRAGKGLSGYFGNPFSLKEFSNDREECLKAYKYYFLDRIEKDDEFRRRILSLRGKVLGCFCKPKMCHGDIIVWWLERNR